MQVSKEAAALATTHSLIVLHQLLPKKCSTKQVVDLQMTYSQLASAVL